MYYKSRKKEETKKKIIIVSYQHFSNVLSPLYLIKQNKHKKEPLKTIRKNNFR